MTKTDAELRGLKAEKKGQCSSDILRKVLRFAEKCDALSDEDKERVISGLADWI